MTPLVYVTHSAVWFAAGFIVRLQLGTRPKEAFVPMAPKTTRSKHDVPRLINIAVVVLVVVSAVQSYLLYDRTRYIVTCLNAYAVGVGAALDARSTASADAQRNMDEFLAAVGQVVAGTTVPGEGRPKVAAALDKYFAARKHATEQQKSNPYPPAPVGLCK